MNHSRSSMAVALWLLTGGPAAWAGSTSTQPAVGYPQWTQGQSASYVITCEENRESRDSHSDRPTVLSLKRTIHLTVRAKTIAADGSGSIECTLNRIQLEGQSGGRPIAYDSQRDQPGKGNATADLLSNIAGQQFRVRLDAGSEFKAVAGLDGIWRGKGLLAPPVPSLSTQFLFRDQGMLALLREALAPAVPADLRANSVPWTARLPLNVPGVSLLEWPATFEVARGKATDDAGGLHVSVRGPVEIARPMADVGDKGLTSSIVSSNRQADFFLDASSGQVRQSQITGDLVLSVKLIPPIGGDPPVMQIRQSIRTTATRHAE